MYIFYYCMQVKTFIYFIIFSYIDTLSIFNIFVFICIYYYMYMYLFIYNYTYFFVFLSLHINVLFLIFFMLYYFLIS